MTIRTNLTERLLPTVSGTLRLQGLDAEDYSTGCSIDSNNMLWDTGSHCLHHYGGFTVTKIS